VVECYFNGVTHSGFERTTLLKKKFQVRFLGKKEKSIQSFIHDAQNGDAIIVSELSRLGRSISTPEKPKRSKIPNNLC
jgi:hypothetical protein